MFLLVWLKAFKYSVVSLTVKEKLLLFASHSPYKRLCSENLGAENKPKLSGVIGLDRDEIGTR